MQRKMDQAPTAHGKNTTTIATTATLAKKHSTRFVEEVVHPRGIKLIEDSRHHQALDLLQQSLNNPNQLVLKQALGNAFVELDASEVAKGFGKMKLYRPNEATYEAEYHDTFLKNGGRFGKLDVVCRCVQPRMIVNGPQKNTWIPLPIATNRRESGIVPSIMVWDLVKNAYPDKTRDSTEQGQYFIPDHIYAFTAKDKEEREKIDVYQEERLPGFLLMKGRNDVKPPYLIQESKDHRDKQREALQYLSLLAASALHDRMLLRTLTDKAQTDKMITLEPELCIYGMTCCAELVTIYKMSIRDIWSMPNPSKINDQVRYDFMRLESLILTGDSQCERLSKWMNILHFYGQTSHAESVMQDGEKAYSSEKLRSRDWKNELSKVVFLYGEEPNIALFTTKYANIDNEEHEEHEEHEEEKSTKGRTSEEDEDEEGDQGRRRTRTRTRRREDEDEEEAADDPAPKRHKVGNHPCGHECRNKKTRRKKWCTHKCCVDGRQPPVE
jgi:hypothetical protein